MNFGNNVHDEYNKINIETPKNIKQLRDRFRYLYKDFEKTHCVDLKLNKNLYKGNFLENHKTLVHNFIEVANLCFHKITYNSNHVITLADDFCTLCYSKKYPNLTEEDFKQMNELMPIDKPKNEATNFKTNKKISYKRVLDHELNKVSNMSRKEYSSLDVENASSMARHKLETFDHNIPKDENKSHNSTISKKR